MAHYLETPERIHMNAGGWKVVYDPAAADPAFAPARVVGLMPTRGSRRKRRFDRASIPELLDAIRESDREAVFAVMLDEEGLVFAVYIIGMGGPNASVADQMTLMRGVLLTDPESVVLVHNHPSGYAAPSREDQVLTARVQGMLRLYGYELVDHLILAGYDSFSFAASGMLED